ncbi:TIGR04222 domain-containing membrane protein [Nostoc sp. LEGE 06077]|uniref:TIGR04222 domain-containing membrane protein n=1 Tax=Nostoc sp. LEGE 06077 TaxID=915325 RepID=UPI00187F0D85|nr:TIGR04222 domain-containing membrane protein [Nostoc sp. LEGE 06077]MBE9206810.1 TIGR04222 domain-containing membrane protein [Nostoc sp. LEGE 06077]
MDALLHNFVADMYGPNFLLLYGIVIIATLLLCGRLAQDPTKNQPLPLIPAEPDPYKIAYLRSQAKGIAHLVLFNLVQQGYLQVSGQTISKIPSHPDTSNLEPIEKQVLERFSEPATAKISLLLATECVQSFCIAYQEQLHDEKLLYAGKWQIRNVKVSLIGAMLILSLGGYKLLIALDKGRYNVSFLIVMGVCSIIYLLWFVSKHHSPLSHLGKRYLQQLQTTFAQLIKKARYHIPSLFDYNLLIAIFGVEALAGTSYDSYYKAFFPPTYSVKISSRSTSRSSNRSSGSSSGGSSCSSGSSGCSSYSSSSCSSGSSGDSSCSSGSSCGSSCGGGCGGCGGGD